MWSGNRLCWHNIKHCVLVCGTYIAVSLMILCQQTSSPQPQGPPCTLLGCAGPMGTGGSRCCVEENPWKPCCCRGCCSCGTTCWACCCCTCSTRRGFGNEARVIMLLTCRVWGKDIEMLLITTLIHVELKFVNLYSGAHLYGPHSTDTRPFPIHVYKVNFCYIRSARRYGQLFWTEL